jgi:hypothetical protein
MSSGTLGILIEFSLSSASSLTLFLPDRKVVRFAQKEITIQIWSPKILY